METCSIFFGVFDALDLWVILPFLLGYFSWKFLFVGLDVRYDKLPEKTYTDDDAASTVSSDDEDEKRPAADDISSELLRLREEIRLERAERKLASGDGRQ